MTDAHPILIYQNQDGSIEVEVHLEDESVWLTQEQMALLFGKAKSTISEHIKNIFEEGELVKEQSMRKIGNSEFSDKPTNYYNLDVIISVGYRVKSQQGTQFRQWATSRLKEYMIKGFALNDDRFKSGSTINYFNELQQRIREIRISERFFYQKIKDIYTTSIDYDSSNQQTISFFAMVQNKLLWAISQQTAAELVYRRVDATLPLLGMQSFAKNNPTTTVSIKKSDVSIAKNYLNENEMTLLGLLVEQYLAFAETMALQQTPMYMADWAKRLDGILQLNGRELLSHSGSVSHDNALKRSDEEYQKYKLAQKEHTKIQNFNELEQDVKRLGLPK